MEADSSVQLAAPPQERKLEHKRRLPTEAMGYYDAEAAAAALDKKEWDQMTSCIHQFTRWVSTCGCKSLLKEQIRGSDRLSNCTTNCGRRPAGEIEKATVANPLDCSEALLYELLNNMRTKGAPLTRGPALLQACRLAAVVAGTEHLTQLVGSKRLVGASQSRLEGVVTEQRASLTLLQFVAREKYMCNSKSSLEQAFLGQLLFCIYAQAHWSDAQELIAPLKFDVEGEGPG
eukprot:6482489-Amphidinium_carterae.1